MINRMRKKSFKKIKKNDAYLLQIAIKKVRSRFGQSS